MFSHATNTAWFFSVLIAALIFSLSLAGVAAAQGNTSFGTSALQNNTTGEFNTAIGLQALFSNSTGSANTAIGVNALRSNIIGNRNIAIGFEAGRDLTTGDNNIAIGNLGVAGESNTIRIGDPGTHTTTVLSGNVGIGTTTPGVALDVVVPADTAFTYFTLGSTALIQNPGGGDFFPVTIRASGEILARFFIAISDERIKNIQGRSDSAADLRKLLDIEVTDFLYKDVLEKGSRPQKKVIAQQVEKVYPEAVRITTDVVPDIYKKALINNGWVELATDLKVGDRVRLITQKGNRAIHEVLEVKNDKFRTDFAEDGDVVFVYGREVKDFRNVDYDAIAMLNVSATAGAEPPPGEAGRRLRGTGGGDEQADHAHCGAGTGSPSAGDTNCGDGEAGIRNRDAEAANGRPASRLDDCGTA